MKRTLLATAVAWAAFATTALAAPPPESKLVDLTFLRHLQAGEVSFIAQPLSSSPDFPKALETYPALASPTFIDPAGQRIVDKLLAVHKGAKPEHVLFLVSSEGGFNCSTLPTGQIVCTHAVMELLLQSTDGEQMLAFLLAHELGHRLIAGHGARFAKSEQVKTEWLKTGMMVGLALDMALSKRVQTGNTITITVTPAATSALWNSYFGGLYVGQTASGLQSLSWSQKEEDEADQFGIYLMQQAGYDVSAASQLFQNLDDLVRANHMQHDSFAKQVASKAASAMAIQALVNGKGWANIVGAGVLGGASAVEEVSKDHYHRDFIDRKNRCGVIAKALLGEQSEPDTQAELKDIYLAQTAPPKAEPVQLAEIAPPPAPARPVAKSKGSKATGKSAPANVRVAARPAPPAPPPLTEWEQAQLSVGSLQEVSLSEEIIKTLAQKGDKDALAMCPASPHTAQLAFSCGVALAGNAQNDQANALFDQALAAPEANPKMFSKVALTQAEMKDEKRAMATLDVAEQRFAGGLFYSDRISVALANGDLASAKAAGDRCQKDGPDSQTKLTCSMLLAQSKAKT